MAVNGKNGAQALPVNFTTVSLDTLPTGRKGKHHIVVAKMLKRSRSAAGWLGFRIIAPAMN